MRMKKCPYCGFENEADDKYCPNCGKSTYHCKKCQHEIVEKVDKCPNCGEAITDFDKVTSPRGLNVNKLKNLQRIFDRIATIATLVMLCLALFACLGKYLNIVSSSIDSKYLPGTAYYYLLGSFLNSIDNGATSYFGKVSLIYQVIRCLIVLSNIIIVYIFAIKGIIHSIKDLKRGENHSHKYIFIVYLSLLICSKLLLIFENVILDTSASLSTSIINLLVFMSVLILFEIVTTVLISYRRHQVISLIEKAIYGTLAIFVILLILGINKAAFVINGFSYSNASIQYWHLLYIFNGSVSNNCVTIFVASTTVMSLQVVELIALALLLVFFTSSFFNEKDNFKLKMTTYIFSLFVLITVLIQFVTLIALLILLVVNYKENTIIFGSYLPYSLIVSALMFSLSVYSFVVSRNKRIKSRATSENCSHNN